MKITAVCNATVQSGTVTSICKQHTASSFRTEDVHSTFLQIILMIYQITLCLTPEDSYIHQEVCHDILCGICGVRDITPPGHGAHNLSLLSNWWAITLRFTSRHMLASGMIKLGLHWIFTLQTDNGETMSRTSEYGIPPHFLVRRSTWWCSRFALTMATSAMKHFQITGLVGFTKIPNSITQL
jgi:hypothetical protein